MYSWLQQRKNFEHQWSNSNYWWIYGREFSGTFVTHCTGYNGPFFSCTVYVKLIDAISSARSHFAIIMYVVSYSQVQCCHYKTSACIKLLNHPISYISLLRSSRLMWLWSYATTGRYAEGRDISVNTIGHRNSFTCCYKEQNVWCTYAIKHSSVKLYVIDVYVRCNWSLMNSCSSFKMQTHQVNCLNFKRLRLEKF